MKKLVYYNRICVIIVLCFSFLVPNLLFAVEVQKKDSTILKSESTVKRLVGCYLNSPKGYDVTPQINRGLITSFDQALAGKIAGVQIMTNDGRPLNGSFIQIRGASSLMGTTQPLIVLDGIPLSYGVNWDDISSQINPGDIQTISILKDAASIAQYGMQGSNGVIVITSKKGKAGKLSINFTSMHALQTPGKGTSMLSPDQFRNLINSWGYADEKALLGSVSTNWNDAIYQNAFATNNQLSLTGEIAKNIPVRASIGFLKQDGTLRTESYNMFSGNLVVSPSFFEDHLNMNLNVSGTMSDNRFANDFAIASASLINPTQPITSDDAIYKNNFGGYWQSIDSWKHPNYSAPQNPLAILNLENQTSKNQTSIVNFDLDYKFHSLPELHLKFRYGLSSIKINENYNFDKADTYYDYGYGLDGWNKHSKKYETTNLAFQYDNEFNEVQHLNVLVYCQTQKLTSSDSLKYNTYREKNASENYMVSFNALVNYNYSEKYLLSFGVRHDINSRYTNNFNSGNFPTASLTYIISNGILKGNKIINDLRVKLSYGASGLTQSYGNNSLYNARLTFESTESKDIVLNYGLFNDRINGEVDFYNRTTKNLTNIVSVSNSTGINTAFGNTGNLFNHGFEFTLNTIPIRNNDICWSVSMNAAYNKTSIIEYSKAPYIKSILGNFNNVYFITKEGYAPNMFYAYEQKYSANGKPVEGSYIDSNSDGYISDYDKITYHSATPDWLFGINSLIIYKKWSAGCSFRGSLGNYVYNAANALYGNSNSLSGYGYLRNISTDYLKTGFEKSQYQSNYYVENASFLKMDYLNIGYDFGKIGKDVKLKLTATVQNVFTITGYTGVDPEIPGGVDYGFYPRPRIFSIGLNLEI
ncbi:MAG: TonB-dependent receptor [Paludibacter sp.]|nr:TonB-dependent receptor [Paludibacter sp.]